MQAIVIATVQAKCLVTMAASITEYVPKDIPIYLSGCKMIFPRHRTILLENTGKNFGEAYNEVCKLAFQDHDEIVVCNDDIVFTPYTWQTLSEDVSRLKGENIPLGWVGSRCDYARGLQNIRVGNGKMHWFRWETEYAIIETPVIAPICAYISKNAWVDYLSLDWYSDDVQCLDMADKGLKHYVSRAYVHHVGSQTIGKNSEDLIKSAKPVIRKHRPKLYKKWFGKK